MSRALAILLIAAASLAGQKKTPTKKPARPPEPPGTTKLADHLVWENSYRKQMSNPDVDSAVVDPKGVLWLSVAGRIIQVAPDGRFLGMTELVGKGLADAPENMEPPEDKLAVTPDGTVGLITTYFSAAPGFHPIGVQFGRIQADRSAAGFTQIAGPDHWVYAVTGLSDNRFLTASRTDHVSIQRFDAAAKTEWERETGDEPDTISVAPLAGGGSCVASSHNWKIVLLMLDADGKEQHRASVTGVYHGLVPGPDGGCVLLHDAHKVEKEECYLTSFNARLNQNWTSPVRFHTMLDPMFGIAVVKDGYIVKGTADRFAGHRLFLAKYDFKGQLQWTIFDDARSPARFVLPVDDGFYLVGAEPHSAYGLYVIRGK
jgi:hypothetical protein